MTVKKTKKKTNKQKKKTDEKVTSIWDVLNYIIKTIKNSIYIHSYPMTHASSHSQISA